MNDTHIGTILRAMMASAVKRYAILTEEVRRQTVREEWASWRRFDLAPHHFDLGGVPPGRRLDEAPDHPDGIQTRHAFDAGERLVATRTPKPFAGSFEERLSIWTSAGIAEYEFRVDEGPPLVVECSAVRWLAFDARGDIARIDALDEHDETSAVKYDRDARGRVTRIRRIDPDSGGEQTVVLEHDDGGRLLRAETADGAVLLSRPAVVEGSPIGGSELRAGIVKGILSGLAATKMRLPVYALAIYVGATDHGRVLPPRVMLATEADAQHFRRMRQRNLTEMAWSPDKWISTGLDSVVRYRVASPIAKLCSATSGEVWQTSRHEELVALLGAVADDLRAADLPIPRSRGFVVYGFRTDTSGAEAAADAAHGDARATLERWGLLAPLPGTVAADYPRALLESAPADARERVAALEALPLDTREELEVAGLNEDDIEEGRRILRWCDAERGVPLESLSAWHVARLAELEANPLVPHDPRAPAVDPGPRPDDLPADPEAARLAKLRFLRVWLDGWDDTLRAVVTDPRDRSRLGLSR